MTIGTGFGEVLDRAKAGDHEALTLLYDDAAPLVLGYLRANRAPEPEDLLGDVFVTLVSKIGTFDGDEHHFRSWLLTITHRRMIDHQRRSSRRPFDPASVEALETAGMSRAQFDGDELERTVLAQLDAAKLLDAIDDLSTDQRAVVMLRIVADLSVAETARIVDKSETAVKALLRRALQRLRNAGADLTVADPDEAEDLDAGGAGADASVTLSDVPDEGLS